MEPDNSNLSQLSMASKRLFRRLLVVGENRVDLLTVELQEARARVLQSLLLVLGVAVFVFLAGIALTIAIVVLLWKISPVAVLLGLAAIYAAIAFIFYRRLVVLQRDWKTLPATLDQLRKDRACLERNLD